jgi:cell division protein FtsB
MQNFNKKAYPTFVRGNEIKPSLKVGQVALSVKIMNQISALNFPILINRSFPFKLKFNLKFLLIFSFLLIISLFAFYIFQFNYLTSENYQIKRSQDKIKELSAENENLEIQLTKLNSLSSLENLISGQNFEKIEKIHYIQILDSQMVKQ